MLEVDLDLQCIHVRQRAPQIVAVKSLTDAEIVFGLIPRAKDQIALWTGDGWTIVAELAWSVLSSEP